MIFPFSIKVGSIDFHATVVIPDENITPELVQEKFMQCQMLMQDHINRTLKYEAKPVAK